MSDLGITRLEPFEIAGVEGEPLKLEELVDRRALVEMIDSFERLFGVPIRVVSSSGTTLAGTSGRAPLCALVNEHPEGQKACAAVLEDIRLRELVPMSRRPNARSSMRDSALRDSALRDSALRDSAPPTSTPPPASAQTPAAPPTAASLSASASGADASATPAMPGAREILPPPPEPSSRAPISGVSGVSTTASTAAAATLTEGTYRCFTGALYRVFAIEYDRRAIGHIALGPYLPKAVTEPPASLFTVDPELDPERARVAFPRYPRLETEEVEQIGRHLATVLDVILFSGHKALLTSQMHLATMRENYRELCDKNEHLEEAYERLKELDRLKSNFLATVSHELRTPLTSIMGYGEMLAEGVAGELNEEQKEFVETIRTKSEQLLGLIMSLLDLSKLESGTSAVRVNRLAIATVLEEAMTTLLPTAMKKGVTLELDAPADLPPVLGDAERLRQVFINLTDNAVKFTPAGGRVRLEARPSFEQPEDEPALVIVAPLRQVIEVRVSDTGIGIPESERQKVFDPFYQVDQSSTREYGGAGLGLAIVKRLVEAHQGSIHVEANEPNGATFVVWLPSARTSMAPPASRRSVPPSPLPPVLG
jgi:two-component system, NarL family, sensor histidine kinase BarA